MEPKRPLIIIGTGRCGSSILHMVLSHHSDLAWLSQAAEKFPERPRLSRTVMGALDTPGLAHAVRRFMQPSEAYRFWDSCYPGFSFSCRDLTRDDVSSRTHSMIRSRCGQMLTASRRRLMIKISGWPRLGFLKEVFPDAKFVHIYRDGRAVASSLISRPWWRGWLGPTNWRCGPLTSEQQERWDSHGKSFVVLAGLQWEILMSAFDASKDVIGADALLEVRYEDLCARTHQVLRSIAEFAELEWTRSFDQAINRFSFVNGNWQWRNILSHRQQGMLQEAIAHALRRHGYLEEQPAPDFSVSFGS